MADPRFTPIPTPADAEEGQEHFAVTTRAGYAGWVASHHAARRGDPGGERRWAAYRPDSGRVGRWFADRAAAAAALADQRRGDPAAGDQPRPHTTLYVTDTELATLQALAATLGYYTRRGPHAKERGSITGLATALARAADRNPLGTVTVLRGLFAVVEDDE